MDDDGETPGMVGTITDLSGAPRKAPKREFAPGFAIVAAPSTRKTLADRIAWKIVLFTALLVVAGCAVSPPNKFDPCFGSVTAGWSCLW